MAIIDLHTHILPCVDDGSDSVEESFKMLGMAESGGTAGIVLTPHYPPFDDRSRGFGKAEISKLFEAFRSVAAERFPSLKLFLGAELFAVDGLEEMIENDGIITLNGTRYVLTEFGFGDSVNKVLKAVETLLCGGFIPIIAHPERYAFLKRDPFFASELKDMGALLQINSGSIFGEYGSSSRQAALFLLENGLVSFVASDAHSSEFRTPDLSEAYIFTASEISGEYAEDIFKNNQSSVLTGGIL